MRLWQTGKYAQDAERLHCLVIGLDCKEGVDLWHFCG